MRLLQPAPGGSAGRPARHGRAARPAPTCPGILDPALGGVLRLGGALRVPLASLDAAERAAAERYENWDQPYPHPFQVALAGW